MDRTVEADRIVTIAVDVQNDFCQGGALAVEDGDLVIPPLNQVMAFTREHNGTVTATRDWHPDQTPHFDTWPVHCVADTDGAGLRNGLDIHREDIIVNKGMGQTDGYSGFEGISEQGETLEALITPTSRDERIAVLIGGLATDYCVLNTTLDALKVADRMKRRGAGNISVTVIRDAMRAVNLNDGDEARAIQAMSDAGALAMTSDEIIAGGIRVMERM